MLSQCVLWRRAAHRFLADDGFPCTAKIAPAQASSLFPPLSGSMQPLLIVDDYQRQDTSMACTRSRVSCFWLFSPPVVLLFLPFFCVCRIVA
jgi:hypothetical protein